ncbi:MAG: hypothetical protein IJY74_07235, partial [Oscillospiraceae bacterium]|nr:hypothetical protein [Oscillospiraceae bacterium]
EYICYELPSMPVFSSDSGDKSEEEENSKGSRLLKNIRKRLWHIFIVFLEICLLASVITGICMWRLDEKNQSSYGTDNIVYSSDDIVMMLVKNKEEWILEMPENGYNTCCFLDLGFDGSTELISISYDRDTSVTQMKAYHVRNCKLEEIELDDLNEEK